MAEGVRAGRGVPRGLPAVVHAHPSEVRHAADGVGGLRAPLGVDGRVRQPRRAGHGRPGPSPATWAQARRPPRRTPVSSTCRPGAGGRASVSRASSGASVTARCCTQRPAREGRAAELGEPLAHPGHPGVGHDRLLHQIHRQRTQAWPILRPTRRRCWERAYAHRLAAHGQRLLLGHHQAHPRQVLHLSPLAQRRPPAEAPPPRRGAPPGAPSRPAGPAVRPPSGHCAAADASSSAPARRSTAAYCWCGGPWLAGLPTPARAPPTPPGAPAPARIPRADGRSRLSARRFPLQASCAHATPTPQVRLNSRPITNHST